MRTYIITLIILLSICFLNAEPKYCVLGGTQYQHYDYKATVWELSTGKMIKEFDIDMWEFLYANVSKDGRYILCRDRVANLNYWDLVTGYRVSHFSSPSYVISMAISPTNSKYGLTGDESKNTKYWDLFNGTLLRTFSGHTSKVGSVAFSPDGQYALSGSNDKTLRLWRISDGVCLRTFTGHTNYVNSVKFTPDGLYALSASSDSTIKHWRISDGTCIRTIIGSNYPVNDIAISPDGKYVLSGLGGKGYLKDTLKYWRISDGVCLWTSNEAYMANTSSVDISQDGNYALSGGYQAATGPRYWRINQDGQLTLIKRIDQYTHYSVAFTSLTEVGFANQPTPTRIPEIKLTAYPNPFSKTLTIDSPGKGGIYTLTGKLLYKIGPAKNAFPDTSTWEDGVYVIKVGAETIKVVKMSEDIDQK
jgi:WD40 repeat protein